MALLTVLLALTLAAQAFSRSRHTAELLHDVVLLEELTALSERAARATRDYVLTEQPVFLEELARLRSRVEDQLVLLREREVLDHEEVQRQRALWRELHRASERSIEARLRTGRVVGETQAIVERELLPARAGLEAAEERLRAETATEHMVALERAEAATSRAIGLLVVGFILGLVATVVLGARAAREGRRRSEAERERARSLEGERRARRAAEERQRLLDRVLEQSGDAVIVADCAGVLQVFNAEAERLHGSGRAELAAPVWTPAFGLESLEGRPLPLEETPLYRALHGERITEARWRVRRPDGARRTLVGAASPLRGEDGLLEGAVLTARDETDRLALEEQRAAALAELDALFAAAPVGMAMIDAELRYVRVNERLAAMNGAPLEDHLGRRVDEVLPRGAERLRSLLEHVLETGEPLLEQELATPEGPHLLVSYFPVRLERRAPSGVGAVAVDVTAMKEAEVQMRRALELRDRFVGILGHDLRSPLHTIHLAAQLLLTREGLGELERKSARRILSSAERMAQMIGELLDVTRIRMGAGVRVEPRSIDLAVTCRDIVDELRAGHPEADIHLEVDGDGRGRWDPGLLGQVVSNLVGNAIQHGAELRPVRVRLDGRARDEVELSVHNEGLPIPPERQAEIFEPFRRADGPRTSDGLGLGLYIARHIVRAHGGALEVSSSAEEGTIFRARMPRSPEARPRAPDVAVS